MGVDDIACVTHEVVSFLTSEDLLDYLQVFRKDSVMHKDICERFSGSFRWPLLRAMRDPSSSRRGYDRKKIVRCERLMPYKLASFPHMQELIIDGENKYRSCSVEQAVQDMRRALSTRSLKHLKRLRIVNLMLNGPDARLMRAALPVILENRNLWALEFLEIDVTDRSTFKFDDDPDIGDCVYEAVFFRAPAALDLIKSMALGLPSLKDFHVTIDPSVDVSQAFLAHRWPSLAVLRSAFITRVAPVPQAAPESTPPITFADAWAKGHFPSVTTLVVGEWSVLTKRCDLTSDLPTDGMERIRKLVLTGRVLKSPLLNFRVPGQLTVMEERSGGGGVISAPLFRGVRELDISRLFVPAVCSLRKVRHLGFIEGHYEPYAAAFTASTCRAVRNIAASLAPSLRPLPTLIASDAFFGAEDWRLPSHALLRGAISQCWEALQPARLVVHKVHLRAWRNAYYGQRIFFDSLHMPLDGDGDQYMISGTCLSSGARRGGSGFVGYTEYRNVDSEDLDADELDPWNEPTTNTCRNLHLLLGESLALRTGLAELQLDSVFLHTHASLLRHFSNWQAADMLLDDLDADDEDAQVALAFFQGGSEGEYEWELDDQIASASESLCARINAALWAEPAPVFDFRAALRPYERLRSIVVCHERSAGAPEFCYHLLDLDMVSRLPPASCESLSVRGFYGPLRKEYLARCMWPPFMQRRNAKTMLDYFPAQGPGFRWVEGKVRMTVTVRGHKRAQGGPAHSFLAACWGQGLMPALPVETVAGRL